MNKRKIVDDYIKHHACSYPVKWGIFDDADADIAYDKLVGGLFGKVTCVEPGLYQIDIPSYESFNGKPVSYVWRIDDV